MPNDWENNLKLQCRKSENRQPSPVVFSNNFSSSTSGFYDADYRRIFNSAGYNSIRSESSMSWGEDEFEGESTRIVSNMFIQFDQILYQEIDKEGLKVPKPRFTDKYLEKQKIFEQAEENKSLDQTDEGIVNDRESSISSHPSKSLVEESKVWSTSFLHLRVRGIGADPSRLLYLESLAMEDMEQIIDMENEEIIEQDGSYEDQLSLVNIGIANSEKKKTKNKVFSRVCSGSSDPEVLREHILNGLFDSLWGDLTQTLQPVLAKYSQFLISKSMELSSLSRESSSRGPREWEPDPLDSFPLNELESMNLNSSWRANRPLSGIRRASSAIGRLGPRRHQTVPNEVESVILENTKAAKNDVFKPISDWINRGTSIDHSSSTFSLPSLPNTPRPISSKASSQLLTAVRKSDQRPATTSTLSKLRGDKLNRQCNPLSIGETIAEDPTHIPHLLINAESSPRWSRHSSYLPPIADSTSQSLVNSPRMKTPRERISLRETSQRPSLRTRSKSSTHLLLDPFTNTKKLHDNFVKSPIAAEPVVSWGIDKFTFPQSNHTQAPERTFSKQNKRRSSKD